MNITDIFQIPLFRNFTQKMQEDFLENLEYTLENHPKGKTIIHQGSPCQAIHVLLEGKLNVDVVDVSGGEVRVEVIKAPRTFATPHVFAEEPVPRHLLGRGRCRPDEDFQRFIL